MKEHKVCNKMSDLETLISIFPDWDKETIAIIHEANGSNLDRSVQAILAMSEDKVVVSTENNSSESVHQPPVASPAPSASSSPQSTERGTKTVLPADFLRVRDNDYTMYRAVFALV